MRVLAAALLALLGAGCAHTEVTVLFGPRTNRDYTELVGNLSVVRKLPGRKVCAYEHQSEIRNGPPFNDVEEQTSDFAGCGIRWSK